MKLKDIEEAHIIREHLSTEDTGPYIEIETDRYIKNTFDKSKLPDNVVFEIIEKGSGLDINGNRTKESNLPGVDVLGRPNNDVTHIIKVDSDKLTFKYKQPNNMLVVVVYLKDLNIPFVNLTSPKFTMPWMEYINDDTEINYDALFIRARRLSVSLYLTFPSCVTKKITYPNEIIYDGFHGMWFTGYNKLRNYNYYEHSADSAIEYRQFPKAVKTVVATQQEAASLEYDLSPRCILVIDPYWEITDFIFRTDSLFKATRSKREGSYLKVYIYNNDKEYVGSFVKEWDNTTRWGDAVFRDNLLKLDFPAELAARIKYGTTYYFYVTFYNSVIGECGYTSELMPFNVNRLYGLTRNVTITPHIKSETNIYADINVRLTVPATNVIEGTAIVNLRNRVHVRVLDPNTRKTLAFSTQEVDVNNFTIQIDKSTYPMYNNTVILRYELEYKKSYIIQVVNEYYDSRYESQLDATGAFALLTEPYEQLVTFDTLDAGGNPLATPAYRGEVRISREDKMAYIKLPQFKSFVGDVTLKEARFWLYADSVDRPTGNYSSVPIFYYHPIPIDAVPLVESDSDTTEEIALPLSDEALYTYKIGYDSSAGWDEHDCILPVDDCSVRYIDTYGRQININLSSNGIQCVDPNRYGESLYGP